VDDHKGDTYRGIYTVKYARGVYVLHAFQKKSKKGIAMPKAGTDRQPTETGKRPLCPNLRDHEDRLSNPKRGTLK
jgi:phage-related protein